MSGAFRAGDELTALLLAKDHGRAVRRRCVRTVVQGAIDEAVARQVAAGVSIVSDGELGKVGYSTYIIERLEGFGGHSRAQARARPRGHPELAKKLAAIMGAQEFIRAALRRPGAAARPAAAARRHPPLPLRARPAWARRARVHELRLARARSRRSSRTSSIPRTRPISPTWSMRCGREYEAIVAAGFELQLDCPDLAMSRHTGYQDMGEAEIPARSSTPTSRR